MMQVGEVICNIHTCERGCLAANMCLRVRDEISKPEHGEHDKGPWDVSPDGRTIQSDDFCHDVTLHVSGDFWDDAQRKRYADNIARKLNQVTFGDMVL